MAEILERVADDIGAELRRVATILTNLESAMLAADRTSICLSREI